MADTCCNHACDEGRTCPRRALPLTASDLAAGQRALHTEDGGTWFTGSHRVLRLRPEQPAPKAAEPAKPTEAATDRSDRIGLKTLLLAGAAALAAVLYPLTTF